MELTIVNKTVKKTTKKTIYIGADHTGFDLKNDLKKHLTKKEYKVIDLGGKSPTDPDDYPDFANAVGTKVSKNKSSLGVLICGTGVGICIAANKINGIRAALVYDHKIADLAIRHDAANILCLGARVTKTDEAIKITDIFLDSKFEKGRHLRRVNKIKKIESSQTVKKPKAKK